MMNVGDEFVASSHGLSSSLAWRMDGVTEYVLEGNVSYAGAVKTWLRDDLEPVSYTHLVCNVVKTFKHTRILQMATRPFDFWSTMCNEGELLEKFNIQLSPIPMTELVQAVRDAQADEQAMAAMRCV